MTTENAVNNVEKIDEVNRKAVISISEDRLSKEYNAAMDRVHKSIQIKGFRPGKAPRAMIEKIHGERIKVEVSHDLIQKTWEELLKGMSEKVIGAPKIQLDTFEPGKSIKYTADFAIYPEPEIVGYDSFEVKVNKKEVKQEDVDKVLNNLLKSKATTQPVENRKVVEANDVVEAVLIELIEGVAQEKKEPFTLPLGDGMLPQEIETALVGMEIGAEKDVFLPFGANASTASAEKPNFRLVVNSISSRQLPELTDQLVSTLGFEGIATVLELKADINKRLEEELNEQSKNDIDLAITDKLLEQNNFLIPEILLDDEIRYMAERAGQITEKDPEKEVDLTPFRDQYKDMANKRVKYTIIVDRIAEKEQLKASTDDLNSYCQKMSESHNLPVESVKSYFLGKDRYISTFLTVTRDKVQEFLRTRANVTYN